MAFWNRRRSIDAMLAAEDGFYWAHRGGSASFPEHSLHAYTQSVLRGFGSLEISLNRTADGVWFGLHDANLDRTSQASLGIADARQKIFDPAELPDWIAVVTHWRERLHAVAREVRAGQAGVMFADEKALQYCEVLPLLRLPERRRLLAGMMT